MYDLYSLIIKYLIHFIGVIAYQEVKTQAYQELQLKSNWFTSRNAR